MKKIAFNVVSVVVSLLVLVSMVSCGGGGGGGSSSSGVGAGELGEPSGTSTYGATAAYPNGFYALWIFDNDAGTALYFKDATHAYIVHKVANSNSWDRTSSDPTYYVEISNGSQGCLKFSATEAWTSRFSYNLSDNKLIISNTARGTKTYTKCPYDPSNPYSVISLNY